MKNAKVNSLKAFCLQDNARVHTTCKVAMDAVEQNGYKLMSHPTYSPDLVLATASYSQT